MNDESLVIVNGPTRTYINLEPDDHHVCEKCRKRPAIKTGSEGYECRHCAAGLPDPFKHAGPRIGRNDPCPCGSTKKYKKCCMNKPLEPAPARPTGILS